ncbi:glycosyltransferase [Acinetobacter haemolyticus]|uniref:glycosyltransferase family 4 protein n=1 Tax=Acinetobacter haemolyticus TaxID=29430 RepID=UPI001373363C|nr:glycosyltransferase family 4 protein [Acinetobacter haemolyticus]NAR53168.1 glycosyltransferase [Acinetobacter haemolyticus]NAR95373.1 glycosyltransferase [Acinetobacter haemolyticus]
MNNRFFIFYDMVFRFHNGSFNTEIGGVQRYLYELSLIIKELNYEVFVVQLGNESICSSYEGINVIQLNLTGKSKFYSAFSYIKEKYNFDNKRDVVIWGADTISRKLPKNIKSISIQHGIACDMVEMDSKLRKIIKNIGLIFIYKFFQRAKAINSFNNSSFKVCVDYNYLNWYRTFQKKNADLLNNITVIPNFSKLPQVTNTSEAQEPKKIRIGFARRFVYKRGVNLMIALSELLLEKYKNIEIVFAGDGPLKEQIIVLKNKFPQNINITSFNQDETFLFHSEIDISIVPTIGSEGTSLSLLEAMASKTAVVCTNVGGMSNIVIDNFNGFIINPDVEELFLKVSKLIEDKELRNRLSNNAYLTVSEGFSFELWKQKWIEVILKVIDYEN